jgi:ribonuclease HI
MIKKLPENALLYLLEIFNKFYKENYFPRQWRKATIIPIPKPNKNHNNPNNYRPIALTSVICKTMERIINERLLDWLNMTKKLNTIQCGARKFRSTTDHLIRLETMIRHTFAHNEHVISIFFDLEKAYDTTWKYGIMNDLHRKGFRGLLPKFIDEFLKDRTFNVKVGNILSDTFKQETGVPQGSVLSVTLFMIKVDQLAEMIPAENRFMSSLFVDDLQISYSHSDLNIIKQKMQTCLNNITQWSNKNGYKFSIAKTNAIHFNTIRGLHLKPDLYLDNQKLNYVENAKFLGIIWDEKLTWRPHLLNLKANCQKLLGLMRSISSLTWGADQNTLKLVYIAYIRSKLDYGSIIYASAHKTNLQIIDSIANEALRISTGAFKSTPIESIYILANEIPLNMRRKKLSLQYYFKLRSNINNPAYNQAIPIKDERLFINKKIPVPFALRIQYLLNELNIQKRPIKPNFSYILNEITTPTWQINTPDINIELTIYPKDITPVAQYRTEYNRIKHEKYNNYCKIFTDGSKTRAGVGAAAVCDGIVRTATLPPEASVFSAEMHAIQMAINIIKNNTKDRFVIFSDSLSSINILSKLNYTHPIVRKIQHDINEIKREKVIEICWIPSHAGIAGNEKADLNAKLASTKPIQFIPIYFQDFYPVIKEKIQTCWNLEWTNSGRNMLQIKQCPGEWEKDSKTTREEEVILNRLRTGHTWLTHNNIMSGEPRINAMPCPACYQATLGVRHILMECPVFDAQRLKHFTNTQNPRGYAFKDLLTKSKLYKNLFSYLKEINAYHSI